MKRIGKVFWGALCMILLFSFSHTSADSICSPNKELEVVKTEKKVKFEWDAVTTYKNGKPIGKKDGKVKYEVYVYQVENKNKPLPDNLKIEEHKYKDCNGIEETSCEIKFDKPGYYFLGVRAKLKKGQGSDVSWSCSKIRTNKNPQFVYVSK